MKPLERKFLQFCRDLRLREGQPIPAKPFMHPFTTSLVPPERDALPLMMDGLLSSGILMQVGSPHHQQYALSRAGVELVYGSEFEHGTTAALPAGPSVHFHGPAHNVQIGDHNTQHVVDALQVLVNAIDRSERPEVEKKEAKSKLLRFIENPVVSGILSGLGTEGIKGLLGG